MTIQTEKHQMRLALDKLEDTKGRIFGRRVSLDLKNKYAEFSEAMDYFYKAFPYGNGSEIDFKEEMERFDTFVLYWGKLMDRIEDYELNHKPNKILVHKYVFPEISDKLAEDIK